MGRLKLLPCPFCGREARLCSFSSQTIEEYEEYWVKCLYDCCQTKNFRLKEKAIEQWNTRKPIDRIKEKLEERQEKLETDMWAKESNNWYGEYCNKVSEGYENAIDIVRKGGVE